MNKIFLIIIMSGIFMSANAQSNLQLIEDKLALKQLVDEFSILADKKDIVAQVLLFTENAKVESVSNGQAGSTLVGRKQIGETFAAFLAGFEVVYHINGQQKVDINGDKATGISYCAVTLISNTNGKRMKTDMGVYYNDDYVKVNGKWLIANRKSNFAWRNIQSLEQ